MRILLAADGSEHSKKVAEFAAVMASPLKAEVTALHVDELLDDEESGSPPSSLINLESIYNNLEEKKAIKDKLRKIREKQVSEIFDKLTAVFREKGLDLKTLTLTGHPAGVICRYAEEEKFDLVILGSRGFGEFKGLLLGSVSNHVVQCAKINVVIVK